MGLLRLSYSSLQSGILVVRLPWASVSSADATMLRMLASQETTPIETTTTRSIQRPAVVAGVCPSLGGADAADQLHCRVDAGHMVLSGHNVADLVPG